MNRTELTSFEYSVFVFNEIMSSTDKSYIPFEIIWDTSLGLARARTILYEQKKSPVLSETIGMEHIQKEVFKPHLRDYDLFSIVRHSVFDYFKNDWGLKHINLMKRPDLLMNQLIKLSQIDSLDDIKVPEYSIVLDFETLDKSIRLPFIDSDYLKINKPVSLVSKN